MTIFSQDFFEVLHISVDQKIKILENHLDFLTFSAKTHNPLSKKFQLVRASRFFFTLSDLCRPTGVTYCALKCDLE